MKTVVLTASGMFDLDEAFAVCINKNASICVMFKNDTSCCFDSFSLDVVLEHVRNAELNAADCAVGKPAVRGCFASKNPEYTYSAFRPAFYLVGDADGNVEICTPQSLVRRLGSSRVWAVPPNIGLNDGFVFNAKLSVRNALNNPLERL